MSKARARICKVETSFLFANATNPTKAPIKPRIKATIAINFHIS